MGAEQRTVQAEEYPINIDSRRGNEKSNFLSMIF